MEYENQVKALRCCMISGPLDDFGCKECPLYGKESCLYGKDGLLAKSATAIEELMAQVNDKDYLIQQQAEEIERLRRDVKKQQEKMIELAKKLPKKGKYVHGKEISREYIGDCLVSVDYEDWRCSVCGIVFEQWNIPKFNYCPNCGAKMGGTDE